MARIRSLKPEFWTDEKIVHLPPFARLLFQGMWNFADDCGHIEDEPLRLKLQILPADEVEAHELIDLLIERGLIERLAGCLRIRNFHKHQRVDRRAACRFDESQLLPPDPAESPQLPPSPHKSPPHARNSPDIGPDLPARNPHESRGVPTHPADGEEGRGEGFGLGEGDLSPPPSTEVKTGAREAGGGGESLTLHFENLGFHPDDITTALQHVQMRNGSARKFGATPITDPVAWMGKVLAGMARARSADPGEALVVEFDDGVRMELVDGQWREAS